MNAELDRLRKEMTKEEFCKVGNGKCPARLELRAIHYKPSELGDTRYCWQSSTYCEECKREAVKDIQFKDDIEQQEKPDNVQHPKHYTAGKYEVIDIIESIVNSMDLTPYQGYLLGNIIKYCARFKHKNGVEDLKKANVYLERLTRAVSE